MPESVFENVDYFVQLLTKAVQAGASDVHFKVGMPPGARVSSDLIFFRADPLKPHDTAAIARHVARKGEDLDAPTEHDSSYSVSQVGRFRVSVFRQRGTLGVVMRIIPFEIPTIEGLGAPAACQWLAERERGLVLVVGATGSGKSSTLASMIGHINQTRALHVITIEDPIEFLHRDARAIVTQREVGTDTASFADALRAALRQDPDVILVGEIRDEITMDTALKAAETGHLVFSTMHTPDVSRTIGRVLALAPKNQSGGTDELRQRFSDSLQGIIAQRLVPRMDGHGMVLASEVLVATGTARATIKRPEGSPPLKDIMEKGVHPYGMHTFQMDLDRLQKQGVIDEAAANASTVY